MHARFLSFVLLLCSLFTACDQADLIDKLATQEEQTFVRQQVEHLRARSFDAIEATLDRRLVNPELRATLEKMADIVPAGEPRSVRIVGAQKHYKDGVTTLATTIEYEFADGWLLAQVAMAEREGRRTVTGFNVYPREQSLADEHRFGLAGKGALHYLFLAAAIAAFAVTVYALVACIRTRWLRRKWLWIVFILLGLGRFAINWTTGDVHAQALHVQLLSASAMAPLGAPLMVSFSIPFGAIAFLLVRRRRTAPGAGEREARS
jgi:hypothetical protein